MEDEKTRIKRKYLSAFCSTQVVNTVLFNSDFSEKDKVELIKKAKELAKKDGRSRVYIIDWERAVNG